MNRPRIGLVLGSGSARGWAHIGVIKALQEHGIHADVVCGSSIGALVGAAYASGNLERLEQWVRTLDFWDVVKLLDVRLEGGLIEGETLMASLREQWQGVAIESLAIPFTAITTDLNTGREVWLQKGDVSHAVRASIALPGLFSPARIDHQWLVDGGVTNPVPISAARAMGAEYIIAVNLNDDLVGRHLETLAPEEPPPPEKKGERDLFNQMLERLNTTFLNKALNAWRSNGKEKAKDGEAPGLFEVMASAINIMQVQITRSRMAGDPPDALITPQLAHLGLLEFDRAEEAIAEGYAATQRAIAQLTELPPSAS